MRIIITISAEGIANETTNPESRSMKSPTTVFSALVCAALLPATT